MNSAKILVVDDEARMRDLIRDFLQREKYTVLEAADGEAALTTFFDAKDIALVLLDVMMPKLDGWQVLAEIRRYSRVPVIMLTALGEDRDEIRGFEMGVDEYVTKPFSPGELLARVRSQLRRYMQLGGGKPREEELCIGGLCLDDKRKEVTADGEPVTLTPTKYEILKLLMQNPGEVFSPKALYRRVWNDEPYGAESTVAVHIRHLREKLEINPAEPRYIKAVWGQGYKLEKGGGER